MQRPTEQMTIMIVEDEEEQSSILVKTFIENGYTTCVTRDAAEAMHFMEEAVPSLILCDIKLIGMDGLTFFDEIRKKPHLAKVPFIFLTAFNSLQMAMDAKKRGAADYIVKPYDLDMLVERVGELLGRAPT